MLTLDDFANIRHAFFSQKKSIRRISRETGFSFNTIKKAIGQSEPAPYQRRQPPPPKLTEPLKQRILDILKEDQGAPPKQRHTAAKIFERLRDEDDYRGGYDQVRRFVAEFKRQKKETFIPLDHPPGHRMEADFGQIYVDFPDGRRAVSVLVLTWAYSDCPFVVAMPSQKTEAILEGTVQGFEFFGAVPHELWWDNPKTVAKSILKGRKRELHPRYQALASHYCFAPRFCMPRRGQEKPRVEGRVKQLQRRWATPVPRADDLAQFNQTLLKLCLADRDRVVAGKSESIGERFGHDLDHCLDLPTRPFDPCVMHTVCVDKYQTAAFDKNRYSVPRSHAFATITVKAYTDRVELVDKGQTIACHRRSYERRQHILEPRHYLTVLGRKPACLDHSPVYRDWRLPACFAAFREELEQHYGPAKGAREYIRVLQLLADHPAERVQQALESIPRTPLRKLTADRVIHLTQALAQETMGKEGQAIVTSTSDANQVNVPQPDLAHYDQFLSSHPSTCDADRQTSVEARESVDDVSLSDVPFTFTGEFPHEREQTF